MFTWRFMSSVVIEIARSSSVSSLYFISFFTFVRSLFASAEVWSVFLLLDDLCWYKYSSLGLYQQTWQYTGHRDDQYRLSCYYGFWWLVLKWEGIWIYVGILQYENVGDQTWVKQWRNMGVRKYENVGNNKWVKELTCPTLQEFFMPGSCWCF